MQRKIVAIIIGALIGFIILNYKFIVKDNKPFWTFEKTTNLSIKDIEAILFKIGVGQYKSDSLPFILASKSSCIISIDGNSIDGNKFIISFEDGHKEYIIIDYANHTLTTQGEWWYRGIYSLHLKGEKTLIKLNIFNVAKKHRWAASLMICPQKNKHKENFEKFVANLESEFARREKKSSR